MCTDKPIQVSPPMDNMALKIIPINNDGMSYGIVDYFLSDVIESKCDYYDFLRAINSCDKYDEINIHINCYGGDLDAAIQMYHSLVRCPAKVNVMIEGACMSAATVVMMAADTIEFCPWSSIMFHSYSGGEFGKYHEIQNSAEFHKKWFTQFTHELYDEFLTEKEMEQLLDGKDLWFDAEKAKKRFEKIFEKRDKIFDEDNKKAEKLQKEIDKLIEKYN